MDQILSDQTDVTQLLMRWSNGDAAVSDELMGKVFDELRRIARRSLRRERQDHTLETGALVNEAYLKLVDQSRVSWANRAQFFALSASIMRRVLVDYARSRASKKRGGEVAKVPLDEALHMGTGQPVDLLALDDALARLAKRDELKSQVVELRFFGGLTNEEIAEHLKISLSTVERHWRLARAWLFSVLKTD